MKTNLKVSFTTLVIVTTVLFSRAEGTNNSMSLVSESWQVTSNRWGAVPIEKVKITAARGDVSAQFYLGCIFEDGNGVPKDPVESFKWLKMAALQGHPRAQRNTGWKYQYGSGVEKNVVEARKWYENAAPQGEIRSQFLLGYLYETGEGVEQDYVKAAHLYGSAAKQGHAMAQNNLGWLYHRGRGVPLDPVEAVKWYTKSAEQGERYGQANLAWIYATGAYGQSNGFGQGAAAQVRSGGVGPNHELAEKWMRQAVDLNSAEGQYKLGTLICSEVDNNGHQDKSRFPSAAEWLKKAAESGHAEAQFKLAGMYHAGWLGEDQRTNCIPWFLKAAAQGHVKAQAEAATLLRYYPTNPLLNAADARGVGISLLRKSAEKGDLNAQYQLARCYQIGDKVEKNPAEAFTWMKRAAEQDQTKSSVVSRAIYELGLMYEKGEGVSSNLSEANNLYLQAAAGYQPDACFRAGQFFEKGGGGLTKDDYEAVKSYYLAIVSFGGGQFKFGAAENLFNLLANGRGISKTNDAPEEWVDRELKDKAALIKYIRGAIQTPRSQFYVGDIYYQNKLVPQDLIAAAVWLRLATDQNLDEARKLLDKIELEMSSEQKELAKKESVEFKAQLRHSR